MDEANRNFEKRHRSRLRDLDKAMGISSQRMKQIDRTIGKGIKKGNARFVPQMPDKPGGSLGVLEIKTEEGTTTKTITDTGEAAYIAGLQKEANQNRD